MNQKTTEAYAFTYMRLMILFARECYFNNAGAYLDNVCI